MKSLVDRDSLVFEPPEPGCVLALIGLPGGGNKIYDRSSYANIGTITGATWVRLPSGLWCLSFDGGDDWISITANAALQMGAGDWSAEAWINITSGISNYPAVVAFDGDGIALTLGRLGLLQDNDVVKGGGAAWATGQWFKVDVTRTGTTYKVYKNGVDVSSTLSQVGYSITGLYYVGRGYASDVFKGYIGMVKVYNRVLSALDIQNHFNREKHLFGVW